MIHEIAPLVFDNQYHAGIQVQENSRICVFDNNKMYVKMQEGKMAWPTYKEMKEQIGDSDCIYLFSIDKDTYFLALYAQADEEKKQQLTISDADWYNWQKMRDMHPKKEAFAAMTALHLYRWYASVQFCGRCGTKAVHDKVERMMRCPKCGNMMFPKISPAIIVAILHDGKILLTKYAAGVAHYALVAGFVEIGETAEECVKREVMEEVGLRIKNVKYYDSQPWGYVGNLMLGFTAELDGPATIRLDENELAVAKWLSPDEIPDIDDQSSLTREMIRRFKHGEL